jgi:hypothetical protein
MQDGTAECLVDCDNEDDISPFRQICTFSNGREMFQDGSSQRIYEIGVLAPPCFELGQNSEH